jgi:hypothetical protein
MGDGPLEAETKLMTKAWLHKVAHICSQPRPCRAPAVPLLPMLLSASLWNAAAPGRFGLLLIRA